MGAGGSGEAFVQDEFLCDKASEAWLTGNPGFPYFEMLCSAFAFSACQSDVGTIRAILGDESAMARRRDDVLLKGEQCRRDTNTSKENSSAI